MSYNQSHPRRYNYSSATIRPVVDEMVDFDHTREDFAFLLMGPTGAGKSRFIEALGGDDTLGISKDQLDSVTQNIATYEVHPGALWYGPGSEVTPYAQGPADTHVYILDTPGFSDRQISEVEIIEMVREWMKEHKCRQIDYILYMYPITDIRLPGSKRRTIEMLQLFCGLGGDRPGDLVVVTTMWDRLWNERTRKAAETRYDELKADIWKGLLDVGGYFTKFTNTRESAAGLLNVLTGDQFGRPIYPQNAAFSLAGRPKDLREARYISPLYRDLLDRIQTSQQQEQILETELADPETQANQTLLIEVEVRLRKNERLLTKFETQLINLGRPPQGFEEYVPFCDAIVEKHRRRAEKDSPASMDATNTTVRQFEDRVGSSFRVSSRFKSLFDNRVRSVKKVFKK